MFIPIKMNTQSHISERATFKGISSVFHTHLRTYTFPDMSERNVFSSENLTVIQLSSLKSCRWFWAKSRRFALCSSLRSVWVLETLVLIPAFPSLLDTVCTDTGSSAGAATRAATSASPMNGFSRAIWKCGIVTHCCMIEFMIHILNIHYIGWSACRRCLSNTISSVVGIYYIEVFIYTDYSDNGYWHSTPIFTSSLSSTSWLWWYFSFS